MITDTLPIFSDSIFMLKLTTYSFTSVNTLRFRYPKTSSKSSAPKRPQAESADSITTDDVNMILGDKVNRARGKRG